jgi:hypothetical protein
MSKRTTKATAVKQSSCQRAIECENVISNELIAATKQLADLYRFFLRYIDKEEFDTDSLELKLYNAFEEMIEAVGVIAKVEFKEKAFYAIAEAE